MSLPGDKTSLGRNLLVSLKWAADASGRCLSLPVGKPVRAILRPVATRYELQSEEDVRCLTEWRNRHVTSFLSEFAATIPRTRHWLAETVGPSDTKILFMVDLPDGTTVGYMGLAFIEWDKGYGEVDAVVRGREAPRHLMSEALRTLIKWANQRLELKDIGVRVRSDNTALEFYKKFGFVEVKRVPLQPAKSADGIVWTEDASLPPREPSLVHMHLT